MDHHLKVATHLAHLLDNQFSFLGFKFGLDPIVGLIPGGGDAVGLLLGFYIIWIGIQLRLAPDKIVLMIINVVFDFLIGMPPVIGDVFDFIFKSNLRNLEIIRAH